MSQANTNPSTTVVSTSSQRLLPESFTIQQCGNLEHNPCSTRWQLYAAGADCDALRAAGVTVVGPAITIPPASSASAQIQVNFVNTCRPAQA